MGSETARETIEFLVRSDCRIGILEALLDDGERTRDDLKDDLDVVRTTLGRNLDALEERNLILADGRTYRLTRTGELIASGTVDLLETVDLAARIEPVASRIPDGEFDVDVRALEDATVVESTLADPYAPVVAHERQLSVTDHARLILPASATDPLETSATMVEDGAVHEVVVTDDLAETLRSNPELAEPLDRMAETENVTIRRVDDDIPYYVGLLDDVVQIGVHDERGIPEALLESDADELREWARERFEAYRRKSELLV